MAGLANSSQEVSPGFQAFDSELLPGDKLVQLSKFGRHYDLAF